MAKIWRVVAFFVVVQASVGLVYGSSPYSSKKTGMTRKEQRLLRSQERKARQKTPQRLARRRSRNLQHLTMKAGGLQKTLQEVTQIMHGLSPHTT